MGVLIAALLRSGPIGHAGRHRPPAHARSADRLSDDHAPDLARRNSDMAHLAWHRGAARPAPSTGDLGRPV